MVYSNKTELSCSGLIGTKKGSRAANPCSFVRVKVGPLFSAGKGTQFCLEEDVFAELCSSGVADADLKALLLGTAWAS